ncbi:translocation protein 1 [Nomia melanderi]|uniref:translocation protein 1 n=1 Tax=Nomia melanderi TaxID=2448451 RepID=UPI0013045766|nr:translocation protein SEC62 [Nomia melanderi]XP_031850431.1 translocation protein SEC62 [Nomia melanderi]
MAERRKSRKRKDEVANIDHEVIQDKPSKDEYAVAKWIRNNVPSKKTKFDRNHNVEYFTGSRAVDALLEHSPWSKFKFETREQVREFLDMMLRHKFFHRAKKVVISEEELCKIRGIKKKSKDIKKDKKSEKESSKDTKDATGGKDGEDKVEEKKKKPKVRLEMHMEQYFVDCNDAYVWIYEPISVYYWFFGTLVVLGAIGLCLFPLWPSTIRLGVYYISVAGAGFLLFVMILATIRLIVFCLLWVPTLGRCHLWLVPNLTADVGFFASFWPLYQYDYYGSTSEMDKKLSKKKKKKEKDLDSDETPLLSSDEKSSTKELSTEYTQIEETSLSEEKKLITPEMAEGEEGSESSESDKSNTGRDFVML